MALKLIKTSSIALAVASIANHAVALPTHVKGHETSKSQEVQPARETVSTFRLHFHGQTGSLETCLVGVSDEKYPECPSDWAEMLGSSCYFDGPNGEHVPCSSFKELEKQYQEKRYVCSSTGENPDMLPCPSTGGLPDVSNYTITNIFHDEDDSMNHKDTPEQSDDVLQPYTPTDEDYVGDEGYINDEGYSSNEGYPSDTEAGADWKILPKSAIPSDHLIVSGAPINPSTFTTIPTAPTPSTFTMGPVIRPTDAAIQEYTLEGEIQEIKKGLHEINILPNSEDMALTPPTPSTFTMGPVIRPTEAAIQEYTLEGEIQEIKKGLYGIDSLPNFESMATTAPKPSTFTMSPMRKTKIRASASPTTPTHHAAASQHHKFIEEIEKTMEGMPTTPNLPIIDMKNNTLGPN